MNLDKPHYGTINNWHERITEGGLGYIVIGLSDGHPQFDGGPIYTSSVIARAGNEIETRNSRYTLGQPRPKLIDVPPLTPDQEAYIRRLLKPQKPIDMSIVVGGPRREFHRFHLQDDTITLMTADGKKTFGAGWLLMSEAEYAHLTKLAYGKEHHV